MRPLVLIPASGKDGDLVQLAERSVRRACPAAMISVMNGPGLHGFKLDFGRRLIDDRTDIVVCMDSDVVVFPGWWEWISRMLEDPLVTGCGAPRIDGAAGLHPSMVAMRAELYRKAPSFLPTVDGRDTGVAVSQWLETQGYLQAAPVARGNNGQTDWWYYGTPNDLWWHLGSGTESAWPGWSRFLYRAIRSGLGSIRHREAIDRYRRRRIFLANAARRIA